MIYFTSDWHLGHKRIIDSCSRPFDTVDKMNETIINNINSIISNKDTLYILGDISLGMPKSDVEKHLGNCNVKKCL